MHLNNSFKYMLENCGNKFVESQSSRLNKWDFSFMEKR